MVNLSRFDIYLVNLDPTIGAEIRKTRPAVIISPNEMNIPLQTVIIAPMTTAKRTWPTRVNLTFKGKTGQIVLDQLRTIDKLRLVKKLGSISPQTARSVCDLLQDMFFL